jgi:hypothetical protein
VLIKSQSEFLDLARRLSHLFWEICGTLRSDANGAQQRQTVFNAATGS